MISILCFIIAQVVASTYNIAITYTCDTPEDEANPNKPCRKWTQAGTVEQDTACFPGEALVWTGAGVKKMADLQIGDYVLGHNEATGEDELTEVRAWLHRFPNTTRTYATMSTEKGSVSVSDHHNVAVVTDAGAIDYVFAKDVLAGGMLKTPSGTQTVISRVSKEEKQGLFAPLTQLNNFYVGQTMNAFFLAHSFAHIANPRRYEQALSMVMTTCELFSSDLHKVDHHEDYVHPVAKKLSTFFPFLLTKAPVTLHKRRLRYSNNNDNKQEHEIMIILASMANSAVF